MWIVVALLAALVVVLGAVLLVSRQQASRQLGDATQRGDRLEAEGAQLRSELESTTAAAARERADAAAELDRAKTEQRDTVRRLAEAEARSRDTGRELAQAQSDAATQRARAESAEAERDRVHHELIESESRNARLQLRVDASETGQGELDALWRLELARSERTWRYSVAPLPLGPSPFDDAEDPLRLAVEVEAAALREEVGAPLAVRWEASPIADPGHALLVLRLAQELLAAAAREGHSVVLAATGYDDVVLHLTGEDGEPSPEVAIPPVADHLVSVGEDPVLRLVVHQDRALPAT